MNACILFEFCAYNVFRTDESGQSTIKRGQTMAWTKPTYTEWRFGFEVTMYICTR